MATSNAEARLSFAVCSSATEPLPRTLRQVFVMCSYLMAAGSPGPG